MKHLLPTVALAVACILAACTKTIPVTVDTYSPRVSIESLLEPGTTPRVHLNKTVPFFSPDQTPSVLFLRDAEVIISSDLGAETLVADSLYDRFFCRWQPFYQGSTVIQEDVEYTLTVRVNGETYSAVTVTDVTAVTIDSVGYTTTFTDLYGGHEGVIVDFMDIQGEPNQYRFQMDRPLDNNHETVDDFELSSVCMQDGETYVVADIGRFVYFDTNFDGAPVRFVVEPAHTNRKGDPATVYIQSMDRASAEFYDVLDRQRESNINPFIEPVFLDSKIDGAIGVFGSIARSEPFPWEFPEDSL
ncbi:MAG: DUF4249 domain-containing protein [Rhodothermales bacterium]|nr:DUF4249 domain-containing protein [Rhodothermales bacterium]